MNSIQKTNSNGASPAPVARARKGLLEKSIQSLDPRLPGQKPVPVRGRGDLPFSYAYGSPVRSEWDELKEQAVLAYESGLLPRSVDSREKAITIALMGKELNLSPMQALCGIYVVNGMTALRGSLMLRLIYERVNGANITVLTPPEKATQECAVEMQRPNGKPHVFRFTLEDARKAGFLNKPLWQQHTATMLRWAAIRTGARIVFADAIAGCYMEDEIPAQEGMAEKPTVPDLPTIPAKRPEESAAVATHDSQAPAHEEVPAAESGAKKQPASDTAALPEGPAPEAAPKRVQVRDLPLQGNRAVTEKQINRLYAIAHGKEWSRQEVGVLMEKWFRKKEAKELNRAEYDRLCNYLLSHTPKTAAEPAA